MALQDYWIDLHFVDKSRRPDGTGGFEYVYVIGEAFRGGAVRSSAEEQIIAGIREEKGERYTITTNDNVALTKDDIIMFVNQDNKRVFLRLITDMTYTPDKSGQREWKYAQATTFEPDLRVVDGNGA